MLKQSIYAKQYQQEVVEDTGFHRVTGTNRRFNSKLRVTTISAMAMALANAEFLLS
ncbi:MAG: hypothetical protein ACC657_17925 [Thiohalomonadales bacterium]